MRLSILLSVVLLALPNLGRAARAGVDGIPEKIAPFFSPPAEFAGDFGTYESPLIFDDGTKVKTPADWPRRRREILKTWRGYLGDWPPLIDKPEIEYLAEEHRDNFTQHKVRVEIAPGGQTVDGYLLVPDSAKSSPAILVVYYDAKTGIGLGRELRDFGYQLAKRGFVALSIGTPEFASLKAPYKPLYDWGDKTPLQPLSALAYVAANCHTALAELPEVDPNRIGVMGHSYGGKWAMFASCLYEKFACGVWSDPGIVFDETRPNVDGHDLHELHALMAPRPFLVSGGAEDRPARWKALNRAVKVNKLLGYTNRVALTSREGHSPTPESNEQIYLFLEHFLANGL
ncbi:MAG: hypothetical protein P8Z79_11290 [Sedimentisphaerales bacterium]